MKGRNYNIYCEFCLDITEQIVKNEDDNDQTITCQKCKNTINTVCLDSYTYLKKEGFELWPKNLQKEMKIEKNQKKNIN